MYRTFYQQPDYRRIYNTFYKRDKKKAKRKVMDHQLCAYKLKSLLLPHPKIEDINKTVEIHKILLALLIVTNQVKMQSQYVSTTLNDAYEENEKFTTCHTTTIKISIRSEQKAKFIALELC